MKSGNHIPVKNLRGKLLIAAVVLFCVTCKTQQGNITHHQTPAWTSPDRYRLQLVIQDSGLNTSNSPASIELNFTEHLRSLRASGTFDKHTVEVIAYDDAGHPVIFDNTRTGYEKYLLPVRVDSYYGIAKVKLNFVMPRGSYTYMVYFDTRESGFGKASRYHGLIGDGDRFTEGFKRREVNASGYDCFADLDGDGDLDLFKGGTEPFIHCYENMGQSHFVYKGKLTSAGEVFVVPHDALNRSWHSVSFFDWDRDGDQDLFLYQPTGPSVDYVNQVAKFENTTTPGGVLTFTYRGKLTTISNKTLGSTVRFNDYDGDGKTDIFSNRGEGIIAVYKNISKSNTVADMQITDGEYLKANGVLLHIWNATPDFADIDNDGDLDLFSGTEDGPIYFFQNVGSRNQPVFTMGRIIAFYEYMDQRSV